jgi:hypothetical protein
VDARQAIEQPLQWSQYRVEKGAFSLVNPGHECSQRFGKCQQDYEIAGELKPAIDVHSNLSGFRSAMTR